MIVTASFGTPLLRSTATSPINIPNPNITTRKSVVRMLSSILPGGLFLSSFSFARRSPHVLQYLSFSLTALPQLEQYIARSSKSSTFSVSALRQVFWLSDRSRCPPAGLLPLQVDLYWPSEMNVAENIDRPVRRLLPLFECRRSASKRVQQVPRT